MLLELMVAHAALAPVPESKVLELDYRPEAIYELQPVPPAPAEPRFGPRMGNWSFTFGGTGSADRRFSSSTWGVNASIGHFFTDNLEVSLRQSLNFTDVGGSNLNASTRVAADFHFDFEVLQPFVGAQIGYFYGDRDDTWMVGPEAGLKWFVKHDVYLFGMAEYQWFFDRVRDIDDNVRRGQFVFSFGIGLLW